MSAFRPTSSTPTLGRFASAFAMSVFIAPLVATSALASCDDTTTTTDDDDTTSTSDDDDATTTDDDDRRDAYEAVAKLPTCGDGVQPDDSLPSLVNYEDSLSRAASDYSKAFGQDGQQAPVAGRLTRTDETLTISSGDFSLTATISGISSSRIASEADVIFYVGPWEEGVEPSWVVYDAATNDLLLTHQGDTPPWFWQASADNFAVAGARPATPTCRLYPPVKGALAEWKGVWARHEANVTIVRAKGDDVLAACTVTDTPTGSCTTESYTITTSGFELFYNEPGWDISCADCTSAWLAGKREVLVVAK